jgi:hypothetical protein
MLADRNATGLRDPHAGVAPGLGEKIGLAERARHIPDGAPSGRASLKES